MNLGIGFDFDHTLAIDNRLERTALIDLAAELGVKIGANEVSRLAQIDTLLAEMRGGKLNIEQMVARWVHSVRKDHTVDGLADRFREICYALVPHHVVVLPGAHEMLAELDRRGIVHAILTNGWSPLQEKKAAAIGYTGTVLVSDAIGVAKPDAEAFEMLSHVLPPGAPRWYVGDNPAADVRGSLAAGYSAIWYHEHAGVAYPSHIEAPTAVIDGLLDIIELIDGAGADGTPGQREAAPKSL